MKLWHRAAAAAAIVLSVGFGASSVHAQTPTATPTAPALAACPADLKIAVLGIVRGVVLGGIDRRGRSGVGCRLRVRGTGTLVCGLFGCRHGAIPPN